VLRSIRSVSGLRCSQVHSGFYPAENLRSISLVEHDVSGAIVARDENEIAQDFWSVVLQFRNEIPRIARAQPRPGPCQDSATALRGVLRPVVQQISGTPRKER
jgi:hypothetical protein